MRLFTYPNRLRWQKVAEDNEVTSRCLPVDMGKGQVSISS